MLALLTGGGTATGLYTDSIIIAVSLVTAASVFSTPAAYPMGRAESGFVVFAILLCIIQIMPMPSSLLAPLRPGFLALPAGLETGFAFISLGVGRTLESLLLVLAPLAFFLSVLRLRAGQVIGLLPFFFVGVFGNLLAGALQYSFSNNASMEGFLPFSIQAGLFANVNHFSTLLFASIPLIVYFGIHRGRIIIGALGLIAVLLILLAAESRAGVLIGLMVTVISLIALSGRTRLTIGAAASVFILLSIYTLGAWSKIDTDNLDNDFGRREFARTTLEGIKDNWPLGIGFGNFVNGYSIYEDPEMIYSEYVNHAHNDYLELLFEGGVPAGLLILAYFVLLIRASFFRETSSLQRAALISIIFILVHSLVDYPLRTMALAITFAFLNGIVFHPGFKRPLRAEKDMLHVEHDGRKLLVPIARIE